MTILSRDIWTLQFGFELLKAAVTSFNSATAQFFGGTYGFHLQSQSGSRLLLLLSYLVATGRQAVGDPR
jgi:hypothetical protein